MGATNMLGLDVSGLDVPAFLAAARVLFACLAVAWLGLLLKVRHPAWLLAGAILANAWVWGVTNYPLQRLYALGTSHDREANLALCQVVAAGNSPIRTAQVGQIHFEPFWPLLVATLSGFDPDRLLRLYPFLPLLMSCGFAVSLFACLRSPEAPETWDPWERVLVAGFATLLSSAPLEYVGPYRVPWPMTFLLKPNHALGLVLFPVVLRAVAGIRTWRGRVGVGVLLHVLAWVFVIHMAYVCVGLVLFAAWSALRRRRGAGRDALDVAVVIGVNLLVVSPYLYMLLVGYPFLDAGPRMMIPPSSPHLLEPTTRAGALLLLTAWGAVVLARREDRLSRLWVAQLAGAVLIWTAYLGLHLLQVARQKDEIYYWLRFLSAATAAIGAWDLAGRIRQLDLQAPVRAAVVCALALPWALPYWWDPGRMDLYFPRSIAPLPESLLGPGEFLRRRTEPKAVVAGDHEYLRYAAALGARRVLLAVPFHRPRDHERRLAVEAALLNEEEGAAVRAAAAPYEVRYLLVTPALLAANPGLSLEALKRRAHYELAYFWGREDANWVALFLLRETKAVSASEAEAVGVVPEVP